MSRLRHFPEQFLQCEFEMYLKCLAVTAVAAMLAVPASAEDAEKKMKGKKGRQSIGAQIVKQLAKVGLTEEQTSKIMEMGKAADENMKSIREAAGITNELNKKRMEAQKSMKDSGKKGKELQAAINEAAGFTEDQVAGLKKMNEARMMLHKKVIGLLTDEQKENLPKQMQRLMKGGDKKMKKKKEKDAA